MQGDFDNDITVRENAPSLLEKELSKLREPGPVCLSSGISDAYQPVEKKLRITRECAKVLARFSHPVIIHTKSSLILRDIDYWEEVHRKSAFTLMISLTMADDNVRSRIEPRASSVQERLETIKEFRRRGMNAGVLAMPFIPFLTDSHEQVAQLLNSLVSADAQFAMPGLLTLKKGKQKEHFLTTFTTAFPDLQEKIVKLYSNEDFYGGPPSYYSHSFYTAASSLWKEMQMNDLIPHSVFHGQFSLYDEVSILIRDMINLYRRKGINVARLKRASLRYSEWLTPRKSYYARRRNLSYSGLEEELRVLLSSGEFAEVISNRKLAEFILSVSEGSLFDYLTLRLDEA